MPGSRPHGPVGFLCASPRCKHLTLNESQQSHRVSASTIFVDEDTDAPKGEVLVGFTHLCHPDFGTGLVILSLWVGPQPLGSAPDRPSRDRSPRAPPPPPCPRKRGGPRRWSWTLRRGNPASAGAGRGRGLSPRVGAGAKGRPLATASPRRRPGLAATAAEPKRVAAPWRARGCSPCACSGRPRPSPSPRPRPRGTPSSRPTRGPPDTRSSRTFSAEQTRMMMGSSHLRNSRITLPMGFSARGSCRNCSAALMGISPNYFSEHLGVYRPVLAALESLNRAVLAAMDATKLEYERASKVDQFVTRFLLRETVSQLQALQSSLEGASDTLEAQARGWRSDAESVEAQSRLCGSRRAGRRALRSVSRSSTWSPGSSDTGHSSEAEMQWRLQVNRLQELIDQLECKAPRLEPLREEDLAKGPDLHILVAQRQVQVAEEGLQDFHRALRCYVDFTGAQSHCLHVSAQKMPDGASFTLYEFWQDEASWRRHQQSPGSKAFQRVLIDHLRAPDTLTTVFFPASWWITNNN
ncbi:N-terminal EF-hand calcium-binding protein 3 isoform X2 [Gorilla gorilla gorilla]|uniref:N-terminal EF-hand calcium-binding protein 3 isoform X2 n=1 Tax=Gorilla gorilla gorilla TaxID=9595 RepID=UPI003008D267